MENETKLVKGLGGRTTFPALRQAAYKCTVQIIEAYRDAVSKLMEVSPLADHVDLREHYIAFVSLENFGIHPGKIDFTQHDVYTQGLCIRFCNRLLIYSIFEIISGKNI